MTDKNKAHAFLVENSKLNDAGDARSVTQTQYLGYMQDHHMLAPETVKAVAGAEKELITGAIILATDDLEKLMKAEKKAGNDPRECSTSVRISSPSGPLTTEVRAERTTTNPSTGEKIVHHGVISVKRRSKTMIDTEAAKATEVRVNKLLG